MIPTSISEIASLLDCPHSGQAGDAVVCHVSVHSRDIRPGTLFFALKGQALDGHEFLAEAFENGASAAVVSRAYVASGEPHKDWPLIVVDSPLKALQQLATVYRKHTYKKVVAITGSNGKTLVKDALRLLLLTGSAFASPGSYNSQLGLPLALLSADKETELGIFEVGISKPGEMDVLERIVAPDFGILTNIGMAHFAAFGSRRAIADEKMRLFRNLPSSGWLILPGDEPLVSDSASALQCRLEYMRQGDQCIDLEPLAFSDDGQILRIVERGQTSSHSISVGTRSPEIIRDLQMAASAAYLLGVGIADIAECLSGYQPASTRMEIWLSNDNIRIVNDTYSSDPLSVRAAVKTAALSSAPDGRKIFAFGGMRELGDEAVRQHYEIGQLAAENGYSHLYLVDQDGVHATADGFREHSSGGVARLVETPEQLKSELVPFLKPGDTLLIKGPRGGGMQLAAHDIWSYIVQRCLWVDLSAIQDNVATFQRHCGSNVAILAMLKALAYGTDLVQLASWMGRLGIHHIGVSSTSEGVGARKAGVRQNVYVFLPHEDDIDNLIRYRLTPVVHSEALLSKYQSELERSGASLDIHLKVDTGMHRLGVDPSVVGRISERLRSSSSIKLTGICTHFSAADETEHDDFTRQQIDVFDRVIEEIKSSGWDGLCIHAANTAAAARFPEAHYNMVRIGLGLYGIWPCADFESEMDLRLAIGVTSRVSALKALSAGASVGYGRTYRAQGEILAAIVPFGYDDGLPRSLGEHGQVLVEGNPAKIIGRISMDQMMIDVTDIRDVSVGAEVLMYGTHGGHTLRPEAVARDAQTIPHELLTRLGRRVHRIFREP